MKANLLQIGSDGGSIILQSISVNGLLFFQLTSCEFFDEDASKSTLYVNIEDAWYALKSLYPKWHLLYPISINGQMIDILKKEYFAKLIKNEFTMERWLQLLTGYGMGF